jgi:hypothetical protein
MQVITVESELFNEFSKKLDDIISKIEKKISPTTDTWIDNEQFMFLMKISRRTAQTYRDERKISFSQIGNKIYYKVADVDKLFEENHVAAKK